MDKNNNPCKVITGKCRLSYEHVFEAASINAAATPSTAPAFLSERMTGLR